MGRRMMCRKTSTSYAPALQTERLSLRPLTRDDENTLHRISNDPLGRRYLWDNEPVGNFDPLAPDEPYFALDNDRR